MPNAWLRERKRDYYYRKAKEEKYRSRASYKLLEVVWKYHFLNEGDVVVDLGAAPGGWLQAARKTVGGEGFVLGVDFNIIQPVEEANVCAIIGDITQPETIKKIKEILPSLADAVISDVSPNVSGVWEVDHARQIELARSSLAIAAEILRSGGNFFVKVFQGDMFDDFIREVKNYFRRVKIIKPKASRAKSAEIFVLGMGMKESQ
ncbi:RlmE family RNA methyltransferase [Candidatus Bathyarchaeota archaeon]|nr:RlmE family RNA methyltransferase [Candidatus Bathyarchaeota archaeon]